MHAYIHTYIHTLHIHYLQHQVLGSQVESQPSLLAHGHKTTSLSEGVGTSLQFGFVGRCDAHGHRLTRVRTPLPPSLPSQYLTGPKGKSRLMQVCGLRRLASPTIERVRRAPKHGSPLLGALGFLSPVVFHTPTLTHVHTNAQTHTST